jgi:hypothetical protein
MSAAPRLAFHWQSVVVSSIAMVVELEYLIIRAQVMKTL